MTKDIDKLVARAKEITAQRETISHDAYGAQKAIAMVKERDALIEALGGELEAAKADKQSMETALKIKADRIRDLTIFAKLDAEKAESRLAQLESENRRLREALSQIIQSDTHCIWTGGAVPEPSHDELGTCGEIAYAALTRREG